MRRTVLAPFAVLALVSALAGGCSDDGASDGHVDEPKDAPVTALDEDQISEAVLQDDNLGEGWTSAPSEDDETPGPGCFGDIDTLTEGLPEVAQGGTEFGYGEQELPFVESSVTVYEDETAIGAVFEQVKTVLAACSTVEETDEDGVAWDLALAYDDAATHDDVDDQFHLSATGSLTRPDSEPVDIFIEWTTVRLGPNVGSVATIDTQQRPDEHATWTAIAVDRLDAVARGEEPEETTAPAPA